MITIAMPFKSDFAVPVRITCVFMAMTNTSQATDAAARWIGDAPSMSPIDNMKMVANANVAAQTTQAAAKYRQVPTPRIFFFARGGVPRAALLADSFLAITPPAMMLMQIRTNINRSLLHSSTLT